ncbi:hypothetical protein V9L05_23785 (plasmid) [Bernardetia sp. Wsw4-3y2]|uniref:hypothetical protein n=1 Tax=Bernardetia sp. Wsw4-3y2 TaxID=3127471 RepID=UPI0030D21725
MRKQKKQHTTNSFYLSNSKDKTLIVFLSILLISIITIGVNNSFAQDFDSPTTTLNTHLLAPTSTIVKGKLFAYHYKNPQAKNNTKKEKLEINLTVKNLRTQEEQLRVFSPDTLTGNYFIFLLPDERYEISVQVKDFRPYVIVIFIPPQTFIYELNREIVFEPILLLDTQIGQHNFFETRSQQLLSYYDSAAFHNYDRDRFEVLKELVDYTINKGSIEALDSLEKITVEEVEPIIPTQYVSSQLNPMDKFKPIFDKIEESFSHGSWEYIDKLYAKQSTGNTYYSQASSISTIEKENKKTIITHFVLFDGKNAKKLTREQKNKLKEIALFLNNDANLIIEIFGRTYSDNKESKKENSLDNDAQKRLYMSAKRTKQVFKYLKRRVDDKSKFHYIVYGMSEKLDDAVLKESLPINENQKENNQEKENLILTQLPPKSPRVELVISVQ